MRQALVAPASLAAAFCAGVLAFGWIADVEAQEGERFGECPQVSFRAMLDAATDYDEAGDIAAIEQEALRLCIRRQNLIHEVIAGEAALMAFGAGRDEAPPESPVQPVAAVEDLPAKAEDVIEPLPESEPVERVVVVQPPPPPELRWMTVYGSAGEWFAEVTDGVQTWYVRQGDSLPSGVRVVSVRLRPPGVGVKAQGREWFLPGPQGPDGPSE